MLRKSLSLFIAAPAFLVVGCNVGMAPTGPSVSEIQSTIAKKPIAEQIKLIQNSPMPAEEKARRIKELQEKSGGAVDATPPPDRGGR